MQALLWRDYLCPWCYLARDRTRLIESLGPEVVALPYDLHPEIPPEGRAIRPGGRLDQVLDHIADECAAVDLPFRKPRRTPRTRRVLEIAEVVRTHQPASFAMVDDAFYRTHWVDGGDLGRDETVRELLADAGVDADEILDLVDDGTGAALVETSMREAREHGVTATPAWLVGDLLIPGVQSRETLNRWVSKLVGGAPDLPGRPGEVGTFDHSGQETSKLR
jgi:predicted DsbA family dithiol-disulfide isomerase